MTVIKLYIEKLERKVKIITLYKVCVCLTSYYIVRDHVGGKENSWVIKKKRKKK